MNLVVDCSFMMSSLLPDEQQKVDHIFAAVSQNKYSLHVPVIFFLECNNVLISSLQRKRITKTCLGEYLSCLSDLPIKVDNFSSSIESLHPIANLAVKHNITSYDASYLELAMRMNASIATLDIKLKNACISENIESAI